jgi:hypothetical protein
MDMKGGGNGLTDVISRHLSRGTEDNREQFAMIIVGVSA